MIAGEYSCACGKTGRHDHGKRFVSPIEGRLTTVDGDFDIWRTGTGFSPTWVAYPVGATRKERRRLDVRRRKALRKSRSSSSNPRGD